MVSGGFKAGPPIIKKFQLSAFEQNKAVMDTDDNESSQSLVGCGQTMVGQKIVIVDPVSLKLCPAGEIGEIWVSGPSIARGYWNRQSETARTFKAYVSDTKEGPFLRTGDLGFLKDGEMFVTGRLKDLIIIDGRNHYPQDIERTVERSHKSLRVSCCAAFSINSGHEEQLVVVAEVDRGYLPKHSRQSRDITPDRKLKHRVLLDVKGIFKTIRNAVSEYHDPRVYDITLLKAGSIPKTSSGKIQRHICKARYLTGTLEVWEE